MRVVAVNTDSEPPMRTYWKEFFTADVIFSDKWVYNWFSNMMISPITIDGITYKSVENYFQAQKSLDREEHLRISTLTPSKSKYEGRRLQLREDWNEARYEIMKTGLRAKFSQLYWKTLLLATEDTIIIEWNNWNDKVWGVSIYDYEGLNLLGLALMEIRKELTNV